MKIKLNKKNSKILKDIYSDNQAMRIGLEKMAKSLGHSELLFWDHVREMYPKIKGFEISYCVVDNSITYKQEKTYKLRDSLRAFKSSLSTRDKKTVTNLIDEVIKIECDL